MSTAVLPKVSVWKIDQAHSVAEFKVKHMMISSVRGHFKGIDGSLELDVADVTDSRVEASIDGASVNTNEPQRDAHLRSADFFDVEKFPALSFRSTAITRRGGGELTAIGDLTIHGVMRRVAFEVEGPSDPVKDPFGNVRIGLAATTKVNPKDFGLTWNKALEIGGILVGDEVKISLDVQFIKA